MHRAGKTRRRGSPYAIDVAQLAPGGASWGLGLDWAPSHIQKAHLAAGGLACIPRKFAAAATQAGKKSMGNPLSIAGSLVLLATHWLRTWRVSMQKPAGRRKIC